jgi:alkyl hydroperoxide reductase subunit F
VFDVIIVGGGPAGMTAAVYAIRKKMATLLLTKEFGGQLLWTRDIENYMGFQYITGPELISKFEEHVKQFPVKIEYTEVISLAKDDDGYFIVSGSTAQYRGKTVILATGKRPRRLMVPGEEEFTGRGVGYCATCDGPLFADKTVAVVGGGNSAFQAAFELSTMASLVYLVVRSEIRADPIVVDKVKAAANIEVLMGYDSREIHGSQTVDGFVIEGGGGSRKLAVEGVFVEIGLDPNSEPFGAIAKLNENQEIIVDCRARTNIPGLFAAGDVTSGPDKQIIIAASEGAKAALGAFEYLLHHQ